MPESKCAGRLSPGSMSGMYISQRDALNGSTALTTSTPRGRVTSER